MAAGHAAAHPAGSDFLGISDDRLLHMRGVARRAYSLSKELFDWPEDQCRQMFLMGFVHDVGYEFSVHQSEHEHVGGELLREAGYEYWEPVYLHGCPDTDRLSPELLVLNVADMQTDSTGCRVSFDQRLDGIAQRYGTESEQYVRAARVVARLRRELAALPRPAGT